jgi:hypothetical protein
MSSGPLNNNTLLMAGGIDTGVPIANSCRFNDNDSARTEITWGAVADSAKIGTWSVWTKRGNLGTAQYIFATNTSGAGETLRFLADDTIRFMTNGAASTNLITTAKFRDPSSWYHIVVALDTTQATASDRYAIYVNGVKVTDYATETQPAQNDNMASWAVNAQINRIGRDSGGTYLDAYLADFHYLDGVVASETTFGKFNAKGHWVPITYNGSYGTNGFHLDFAVAPGTGNGAGTDVSGNGNHFTDSGLAANDQRTDTPTNNCATLSSSYYSASGISLANGNLDAVGSGASWLTHQSTMAATSGKWYYEVEYSALATDDNEIVGGWMATFDNSASFLGASTYGWGLQAVAGSSLIRILNEGAAQHTLTDTANFVATDVLMAAVDIDSGELWFGRNGTWFDSGDPGAGTNPAFTDSDLTAGAPLSPAGSVVTSGTTAGFRFNADDLSYAVPTGFKTFQVSSLTDANDAPIPKGSDYFDILLWSGDDTTPRTISGLDFSPDIVWIKNRLANARHQIYDTVRGVENSLTPDQSIAETNQYTAGYLNAFTADGFTLVDGATDNLVTNDGTDTYVAWCWKMAAKAGVDVQGYTGTGAEQQVTHDLGVVPAYILVNNRPTATNWWALAMDTLNSSSVPITDPETDRLAQDTTAALTDDATVWGDVAPDAVDFTVGTSSGSNQNTLAHVAWLWANVAGFSRQGSYVGNGNANGPFVWCGFRPRMVILKRLHVANDWQINDTARNPYNDGNTLNLFPDLNNLEASADNEVDFLANGFKLRGPDLRTNASAGEYIFLAFAEHPFKYARAF